MKTVMSILPQKTEVNIEFRNILYKVPQGKHKESKAILKNLSGQFLSGKLTAILGPSGAGKSSLLDILAGYRIGDEEGSVLINGRPLKKNVFRRMSCYIPQEECLLPYLTAKESMALAAELKLGTSVPLKEKQSLVNNIVESLGLSECQPTQIQDLSGGEKKRLSIALELINNPPVMFFDEPTSGLDSRSSLHLVNLLKTLAKGGRTIVCSIHQPSAKLFEKFDSLYALSDGNCVYRGSVSNLLEFLKNEGLECPSYHNPADYLIEVASGEYGDAANVLIRAVNRQSYRTSDGRSNYVSFVSNGKDASHLTVPGSCVYAHSEDTQVQIATDCALLSNHNQSELVHTTPYGSSQLIQFVVLLKRTYLQILRDMFLTKLRVGAHFFVAILIGLLYYKVGNDAGMVFNNCGCVFFSILFLLYCALMPTLLTFPVEMNVFLREHLNCWYSTKAFYMAKTMADMPFQILYSIEYTLPMYFMTSQPMEAMRLCMFLLINIMTTLVSQALALTFGAALGVSGAVFVGPVSTIPMLLFSGFFIKLPAIPVYLRWISYLSFVRYSFEGCLLALYDYNREPMQCQEGYCHYRLPEKLLKDIGVTEGNFWFDFLCLVVYFLAIRAFGYAVFKWKITRNRQKSSNILF